MTVSPFTAAHHPLGVGADGGVRALAPMTPQAADTLGSALATFGPWAHYNASAATLRDSFLLEGDGAVRYQIVVGQTLAGTVIIRSPWLAGPYLERLALLPGFQAQGLGSAVLTWFEATAVTARMRNVWLCVSGFNTDAQRLYRRHGYTLAGCLANVIRDGDDELLMRKDISARLGGA